MEYLLQEIEKSMKHGLYQLALFSSLSIPSICGAMGSENGEDSYDKYANWFNTYMPRRKNNKYGDGTYFTADDCYHYRCAVLHQGYSSHRSFDYKRILFVDPTSSAFDSIGSMHGCIIGAGTSEKSLLINIETFCSDIIKCAREWLEETKHTKEYERNHQKLIQRYPKGIGPISGCSVFG